MFMFKHKIKSYDKDNLITQPAFLVATKCQQDMIDRKFRSS